MIDLVELPSISSYGDHNQSQDQQLIFVNYILALRARWVLTTIRYQGSIMQEVDERLMRDGNVSVSVKPILI